MKLGMNDVRQCVTELRSRFRIFAYVMLIVVIRIIKFEAHKNTVLRVISARCLSGGMLDGRSVFFLPLDFLCFLCFLFHELKCCLLSLVRRYDCTLIECV